MDRTKVRAINNMRSKWSIVSLLLLVMMMVSACIGQREFENPPATFQESLLVGTWEAHYDGPGTGVDRLVLRADGTFQQEYNSLQSLYFKTSWNKWRVQQFMDGRIYVHLEGARFYDKGIRVGEKEGIACPASQPGCGSTDLPYSFYDPVYDVYVEMVGELVLSVRESSDAPGGLVLKHMRFGADGVTSGEFYLVEEP